MSEYTRLDFFQIGELDLVRYLAWRRDAYIYMLSRTESGQEYLDNAYRMEQTEPDRKALREKLGKEGVKHGEQ